MSWYHLPSQLFIASIVCIVLIRTFLVSRKNKLSGGFVLLWTLLWSSALLVLFNLDRLSQISSRIGIGRGVDLVVYLALILLFWIVFQLALAHKRLERQLTVAIREQALQAASTQKPKI